MRQNKGSATANSTTPFTVALVGGDTTDAGSTVFVAAVIATTGNWGTVSGFVRDDTGTANNARIALYRRGPAEGLVAGESSWSFTPSGASLQPVAWIVWEVAGVDPVPFDVKSSFASAPISTTSGTTASTGTAPISSTYDGAALAIWGQYESSTSPGAFSGYTNGFAEVDQQGSSDATKSVTIALAWKPVQALGTYESTATSSLTFTTTDAAASQMFVHSAQDARRAADVALCFGGEICTEAGLTTLGVATALVAEATAGTPTIPNDPTGAAHGNGYLLLSSTAAAEWVRWGVNQLGTGAAFQVSVLRLMFAGSLPGADVELYAPEFVSATEVSVTYRAASQKLGVKVGSGTEQLSANAVVADVYYRIDLRVAASTTAAYADWQVDGVDQTQATGTTSNTQINGFRVGWTAAATASVRIDDIVISKVGGHYPLGDMRVLPLKVDPAGTVTVSGSTANFGVMTANGTVAAWNATNARNAVDDIPPTIGVTADGVVAVTASATDYVEFPMETRNAAANGEVVRAVRAYFALWAASATAATLRLDAYDGTTTYSIMTEQDPNADNSTTVPVWIARMVKPTGRMDWTQAKLDALVFRMGSNDATPDIGIHALLAEVAVKAEAAQTLFGSLATAGVDADSAGVVRVTVTPPAGYDTTLHYEESGTPTDVPVTGGTTVVEPLGAPDAPSTGYIAAYPAAEPDPVD